MKLSTKGRYGVKAILDLALHSSEGQISLKEIANRQNLSENYLEQLFSSLRKAEIVRSIRGSQGGYVLAKDADKISVGDVLRALEGSLAPVECVANDEKPACKRSDCCITKTVWRKMSDAVNKVVDEITLENLMEDYKTLNDKKDIMYYI